MAENANGLSEPLVTEKAVLVKNPFSMFAIVSTRFALMQHLLLLQPNPERRARPNASHVIAIISKSNGRRRETTVVIQSKAISSSDERKQAKRKNGPKSIAASFTKCVR